MKLDEMAKSCSVLYAVEACNVMVVDNYGSAIRMLTSSTTNIFLGTHWTRLYLAETSTV
jgi:hypothetical protein